MDELNLIKELLGIDALDTSKDSIIGHFQEKSRKMIMGYCNISELTEIHSGAIADMAVYLYKHRNSEGISKKSEGERSVIFETGIPEHIKLALPLPRIKVGGY